MAGLTSFGTNPMSSHPSHASFPPGAGVVARSLVQPSSRHPKLFNVFDILDLYWDPMMRSASCFSVGTDLPAAWGKAWKRKRGGIIHGGLLDVL